jgi:hypothetical protein
LEPDIAAEQADRLEVSGRVSVGGTLAIAAAPDSEPPVDSVSEVVRAACLGVIGTTMESSTPLTSPPTWMTGKPAEARPTSPVTAP